MEQISDYNSAPSSFATQIFNSSDVNHTTTVIIVVLCVVVGMSILFSLFRFLRHRLVRRSTPLPPVQPIAHYRKQRLTEFAERPAMSSTYSLSSHHSPSIGLSPAASDSSFLTVKYNQTFPSQSSLYLADKGDDQGVPPSPGNDDKVLPTPNLAFNHARRFSSSSSGSASSTPPLSFCCITFAITGYAYSFVFSSYWSCVSSIQHLHPKQEFWKEHYCRCSAWTPKSGQSRTTCPSRSFSASISFWSRSRQIRRGCRDVSAYNHGRYVGTPASQVGEL